MHYLVFFVSNTIPIAPQLNQFPSGVHTFNTILMNNFSILFVKFDLPNFLS
jgi:hypothetical protein